MNVVLFFLIINAYPQTTFRIKEIKIIGEKNVKEKTISAQIKTKVGDIFSESKIRQDIQNILSLGFFKDVKTDYSETPDGIIVRFEVFEKPIIKKIEFKGNKKISTSSLSEKIESKLDESLDEIRLKFDVEKIKDHYLDNGFLDSKIESYHRIDENKNTAVVTFFITEGNKIVIDKIIFRGNIYFSNKNLLKKIKTRRKKPYNQEQINKDYEELIKFYKNNGFIDIKISTPSITFNKERTKVSLEFKIKEGKKYLFRNVSFSNNKVISTQLLLKNITFKKKDIYSEEKLQQFIQKIQELYAEKGYIRLEVKPEISKKENFIDINFNITEGDIVYVDGISIEGAVATKSYVIKREVIIKEGEIFNAKKVRRSMEKIYNLGFFDDVQIDVEQPFSPDKVDLIFTVVEGKPGMLSAGAGYSTVDGLLGNMQISHLNLLGRAYRTNVVWEFGARKTNYEINFTNPWIGDKPISMSLSIYDTIRKRPFQTDPVAFAEKKRGGSIGFGPRFSDYTFLNITYSLRKSEITDIKPPHKEFVKEERDISSSLQTQLVYDTRDYIFDPRKGQRQALSFRFSGGLLGGNLHFYEPSFKSSWFLPTFWKFVLAFNSEVSMIKNFPPSTEIRPYDRYFLGGAESVRGYNYGEVGPSQGGTYMMLLNLEYKFPMAEERGRSILVGAFFVDSGGAWNYAKNIQLKDMKTGVGFGIRFTTPVFPIRLDWGYGLNHKPGEERSQFYFTIGNIF